MKRFMNLMLVVVSCQLPQELFHIHTGRYLHITVIINQLFQTQTSSPSPLSKVILQCVQDVITITTTQNNHPKISASVTKSGVSILERGQQLHAQGSVTCTTIVIHSVSGYGVHTFDPTRVAVSEVLDNLSPAHKVHLSQLFGLYMP